MNAMKSFLCIMTLLLTAPGAWPAETADPQVRQKAQSAYSNGNWQDAFEQYRRLSLEIKNDPQIVGKDFTRAWQCLRELNRLN